MSDAPMGAAAVVAVLTFEGHEAAERVVEGVRHSGALGSVNDVSILEHHANGRFSVHAYSDRATEGQHVGAGAAVGAAVGALVLGPFGLLIGLAGGAGVGALAGGDHPHELLLPDDWVQSIRDALPLDSSALVIVGDPDPVDELTGHLRSQAVSAAGFTHKLNETQSAALRGALEAAQGKSAGSA